MLTKLAVETDDSVELASHVTDTLVDSSKYFELDEGIYLWKRTSTEYKISLLRRFFNLFDADSTDLVFYLKDDDDNEEVVESARHELRRKYWAYALEYIKKEIGDSCFNNVNPSKGNFINWYFGYEGFSITCVVNYDSVRVELYLGNGEKEINKKTFDYIYTMKDAIEGKLNAKLEWNRNDELKGSKVCINMEEVGLSNEGDWDKMAKFHAYWSKKFYDAFVPYFRDMGL